MHYSLSKRLRVSTQRSKNRRGIALLLVAASVCLTAVASAAPLLIRDVTPIDAHSGKLQPQDVLLDGGSIVAMGEALEAPPGTRIIDASGRFLIPGLWDMHVHFSYDERFRGHMGDLFLDYGITSVRDTGGRLEALLPIVEDLANKDARAPRVFYSGPLLDGEPVVYNGQSVPALGVGNTRPERAAQTVATLVKAGASFIKIYEMVSPEMFQALVAAAEKHSLPVAAHVPLSMLASVAGPQVQSMEHLRNIEMDCAENAEELLAARRTALEEGREKRGLVLRGDIHRLQRNPAIAREDRQRCDRVIASLKNTVQVPTARLNGLTQHPPFLSDGWDEALSRVPAAVRDDWKDAGKRMNPEVFRAVGAWTLAMIPRLADAGVPIGAGTDTPIGWSIPGFSLHRELEVLVSAGLKPLDALRAATIVPATFFKLEQQMGQIAPGYVADVLLLDQNPLDDIAHTRSIHMVISRGEVVRDKKDLASKAHASVN